MHGPRRRNRWVDCISFWTWHPGSLSDNRNSAWAYPHLFSLSFNIHVAATTCQGVVCWRVGCSERYQRPPPIGAGQCFPIRLSLFDWDSGMRFPAQSELRPSRLAQLRHNAQSDSTEGAVRGDCGTVIRVPYRVPYRARTNSRSPMASF